MAAGIGLVPLPFFLKLIAAFFLIVAYVVHVMQTIRDGGETEGEAPQNLTLWFSRSPAPTWAVVGQVVGSLVVMALGAHFFVNSVEHISEVVGIPAGLISLVLALLATELPEKFNSVLWLRQDKDTLALGNITGAMVFQSTVPVALGVAFTPWELSGLNLFSVGAGAPLRRARLLHAPSGQGDTGAVPDLRRHPLRRVRGRRHLHRCHALGRKARNVLTTTRPQFSGTNVIRKVC